MNKLIMMDSQKVKIDLFRHSGLDPESSDFNMFWIPAFAGMTAMEGFYETINNGFISRYRQDEFEKIK